MIKKYFNLSIAYAVIAMIFGVFYREFTKFSNFVGDTKLSIIHTHYFMLGMVFFILLTCLEKHFHFSNQKNIQKLVITYNVGLNITGAAFLVRGLTQVWGTELSKGFDASISGIAGIGHILLGISMLILLLKIKNKIES